MKKILFLGSKPIGYKCLEYLIDNKNSFQIEIKAVLSNNNSTFGKEYNLETLAIKHSIPFINKLEEILHMKDVDYIISVQYHEILKKEHIDIANKIAINLHMAPLPEYRGCNQFSYALYNEEKFFGTTIHRLEEGIDSGDIIFENRFPIPTDADVSMLYQLTYLSSLELFKNTIGKIFKGDYRLTPQNNFSERHSNIYYRKDIKKLKEIPLSSKAKKEIQLRVKATSMPGFEPPYIKIGDEKYYVISESNYIK